MDNTTRGSHFRPRTSMSALPHSRFGPSYNHFMENFTRGSHFRTPRFAPPNGHFMEDLTRGSHFRPSTSTHALPRLTITSWRNLYEDHTSACSAPPTLCPAHESLHREPQTRIILPPAHLHARSAKRISSFESFRYGLRCGRTASASRHG